MARARLQEFTKATIGACAFLALRVGQLEAEVADALSESHKTTDHDEKIRWLEKWNADKKALAAARQELATCRSGNQPPPKVYVRREIWGLESAGPFDPITLAYAQAVRTLQGRAVTNPTSWAYQAAIHGTYRAQIPGAPWNACQHAGWFFLPWHRMYLYFFERIVRKAVLDAGGPADFALPYWNYDRPSPGNSLPIAFRTATLPDGSANPLYLASPLRATNIMNGWGMPSTVTSPAGALADPDFTSPIAMSSFGGGAVGPAHFDGATGAVENTPHNVIHGTIGGFGNLPNCQSALMSDPNCAALDPIFWLHHGNIDRLWNVWRSMSGHLNPTQANWLNQSFEFRDENGAPVTLTGAEVLDTASQLDYIYDDQLRIRIPRPPLAPKAVELQMSPPPPPELAAATEKPIVLTGAAVSTRLRVPAGSAGALADSVPSGRRLFLNVEDIEADANPGVAYGVYLETPEGDRHVGNIALFGIEEMNRAERPHAGPPGFRHTFDITAVAQELSAKGLWSAADPRVKLEPIQLIPPPDAPADAVAEPISHPPVRIGRVSLFVA